MNKLIRQVSQLKKFGFKWVICHERETYKGYSPIGYLIGSNLSIMRTISDDSRAPFY